MYRKQIQQIIKDLNKKIVFIVGPRQVGKTWLAKKIGEQYSHTTYLNYDRFEDREIIKKEEWLKETELLILDELHKMKNWKNYLKGVFDTKSSQIKILVTGSARIETFKEAGDSLVGRFFVHRLMPFSISELQKEKKFANIDRLIKRGGFPEPFLVENSIDADRWRNQYINDLIRTDILDFERIHDIKNIQMVFELLRRKIGSPISYNSIARDVNISPITVKKYIEIFEALYIVFKITPYSRNIARSILKEPKIYFYDNGLVIDDDGIKFENFIAISLLKNILGINDYFGKNKKLQYLRTKNQQEVDFAIIDSQNNIEEIIEVKLSNKNLSKNLKYFSQKYNLKAIQLVKNLKREKQIGDHIKILEAHNYLKQFFL